MSASGPSQAGVVAVVAVAAVLLVGFAIIAPLADISQGITEDRTREAVLLEGAGVWVSLDDATGTDETVWKTTGFAVNTTGADDSFVESGSGVDVATDQNWTVSVWARVDEEAAAENMTALSVNGRVLVNYDGAAGNWSVWYYDDGSTDSYQVNVSAPNQPGNYTNVQARANGTHLAIYRNATEGGVANITATQITDAPVNNTNWNGRIEEVRTFDEAIDATNRSEIVNSPVDGQPDLNRTSRIMFDQPDRSTQLILFSSASLTQSNVTFSAGFAEQEMVEDSLLVAGDYDWDDNDPQIRPTAGGELADAPVAYVSYTFEEAQHDTVRLIGDGLLLGGVMVIVLFFAMILRILRQL